MLFAQKSVQHVQKAANSIKQRLPAYWLLLCTRLLNVYAWECVECIAFSHCHFAVNYVYVHLCLSFVISSHSLRMHTELTNLHLCWCRCCCRCCDYIHRIALYCCCFVFFIYTYLFFYSSCTMFGFSVEW